MSINNTYKYSKRPNDAYKIDTDNVSPNQITGYQINGVDVGTLYVNVQGNEVDVNFTSPFKYNNAALNTLLASKITLPTVELSSTATIGESNYNNNPYKLYIFNGGVTGTFKIKSDNHIESVVANILCVGGGGQGGSDGGYWGSGGGGGGTVQFGQVTIECNTEYQISSGGSNQNSTIKIGQREIIKSHYGGRGTDNKGTGTTGGSGGGGSGQGGGSGKGNGIGINNDLRYDDLVAYKNVGGNGLGNAAGPYSSRGGGGGGGAGTRGANAFNWSGGDGGAGIKWVINDKYYGGGGAGQGVNDYANQSNGGIGGGGDGGKAGAANTGGGGGATQGGEGKAGGSGIIIIAVLENLIKLK